MARRESPLEVAIKGGVAGLIGTAVITVAMKAAPAVMERLGMSQQSGGSEGEGEGEAQEPTEKLADKVAEGVLDTSIDEGTRQVAGQAIHWGYGAIWGVVYGIVQSSIRLPHLLHGTIFGGLVTLVASTLVPAMNVVPPLEEQPSSQKAMQTGINFLYGWVTALAFRALSRAA